jgi:hypothetical protein
LHKPLYDRLSASAEEHGMTMHAEILARLEDSFAANRGAAEALDLALKTLEQQNAESRRVLLEERAMLSQVKLMRHLLDQVALSRGVLDKDLWITIAMLSGRDIEGAEPEGDLATLLQATVDAIDAAEEAKDDAAPPKGD